MAEISAEDAAVLSAANSGDVDTEKELVYTGITARATAGFWSYDHALTLPATKAAVIAYLTGTLGYTVNVLDDETTLHIVWEAP